MIPVSLLETAQALGERSAAALELLNRRLPPVSIDSRTLRPGQCFVAIQGPRLDGHDFAREALEKGAAVVIHSRPLPEDCRREGVVFIRVADTTQALQTLGKMVRQRWGGRLVAVTGSMGKTTTRSFAAALLGERHRVLQSPGNLNNQYGVPLTLLMLEPTHERAALELGMNHAGEIRELCRICLPDAAAITNVAPVHLEFFASLDEIAAAKGEILEGLGDGPFAYNADDPRVTALADRFAGRKISFGLRRPADARIRAFRFESLESMRFELELRGQLFQCGCPFAGMSFLYNIAAAAAIALGEGLAPKEIAAAAAKLQAPEMRGQVCRLKIAGQPEFLTILDDSYNSNPEAALSLLETLRGISGHRRRALALGDMLELGENSARLHRQVGTAAAASGIDLLVTAGADAAFIREGAVEAGLPEEQTRHFPDSEGAGDFLAGWLQGGDLLAVKGSRGARMDRLVDRLRRAHQGRPA